jgi:outer membrane protein OmpA-like peptidoglycan-associated protein
MRSTLLLAACLLLASVSPAMSVDLDKLPKLSEVKDKSLLDSVNKSLARQQVKDGQFQFKTSKAQFEAGNEKRIDGLLKIITENSKALQAAFPDLHVTSEGHTDADGTAEFNQMLSLARAKTVCASLKSKGMKLACKPIGRGSSKPLVSPEKTAADKQKNRRVLVQMAK